jgi:hypothetical protein
LLATALVCVNWRCESSRVDASGRQVLSTFQRAAILARTSDPARGSARTPPRPRPPPGAAMLRPSARCNREHPQNALAPRSPLVSAALDICEWPSGKIGAQRKKGRLPVSRQRQKGRLPVSSVDKLLAVRHIVHEYANFVSSAEMVLTGQDIDGDNFKPPVNTHISHAFYLNCRKLADFFQNRNGDCVAAQHYVATHKADLPVSELWRCAINKQLVHVTYARNDTSRDITTDVQKALYKELQDKWREFRNGLPEPYAAEFTNTVAERRAPYSNGQPSEFRYYDLD